MPFSIFDDCCQTNTLSPTFKEIPSIVVGVVTPDNAIIPVVATL
jgi:hypothetical protein